jgi:hypothetical protein
MLGLWPLAAKIAKPLSGDFTLRFLMERGWSSPQGALVLMRHRLRGVMRVLPSCIQFINVAWTVIVSNGTGYGT